MTRRPRRGPNSRLPHCPRRWTLTELAPHTTRLEDPATQLIVFWDGWRLPDWQILHSGAAKNPRKDWRSHLVHKKWICAQRFGQRWGVDKANDKTQSTALWEDHANTTTCMCFKLGALWSCWWGCSCGWNHWFRQLIWSFWDEDSSRCNRSTLQQAIDSGKSVNKLVFSLSRRLIKFRLKFSLIKQ